MRHVRPFALLLAFVAITLPLMPLQQLLIWFWPAGAARLPHLYHRLMARVLGFQLNVSGKVPKSGPAFLVPNHVSWIDIIIISAVAPVSFVAKSEISRWPFFGSLARLQRTVFVERERRQTTGKERDTISARLKDGGIVVLFPEGTSHDGKSLLPFRSSYFAAVHDADVPVVPVTLAYSKCWGLPITHRERPRFAWYADMDLAPHLWNALAEGPLTVDLVFHEHLRLEHTKARKALAAEAEQAVKNGLMAALHGPRKKG